MGYALRAKCDVCGKTVGLIGIMGKAEKIEIDTVDAGQKAGLWYIKKYDKIVCQDCYDEYCKLQQQHKTEIGDFFKGEKRQEG